MRHKLLLWGRLQIERGAPFFAPISFVWASVVFLKNFFYKHRLFKAHRVECTVVSIGNIVAGGTGKTPLVHLLASAFSHRKVVVLSRGYGPIPDEAILLQRRLPHAKVYSGKDRVALARQAVQEGAELIILDDGFQHRRLHRDLDIVLLGEKDPLGKNHFLPWGFLRDFPSRLQQADAVLTCGVDFRKIPTRILDSQGSSVETLRAKKVGLFCGLANPESFKKTLENLGAEIGAEWILADHEPADPNRLMLFAEKCRSLGLAALVTTEKDFVKLTIRNKNFCYGLRDCAAVLPILYVEIQAEVMPGAVSWGNLIAKIEQKIDNRACL